MFLFWLLEFGWFVILKFVYLVAFGLWVCVQVVCFTFYEFSLLVCLCVGLFVSCLLFWILVELCILWFVFTFCYFGGWYWSLNLVLLLCVFCLVCLLFDVVLD